MGEEVETVVKVSDSSTVVIVKRILIDALITDETVTDETVTDETVSVKESVNLACSELISVLEDVGKPVGLRVTAVPIADEVPWAGKQPPIT